MADQILPMSDEIATLVGHFVRPIICCNIWLYHLQIKFDFLIPYYFECTNCVAIITGLNIGTDTVGKAIKDSGLVTVMTKSDQICLLSDQNGVLVRHMFLQGKKIICSPAMRFENSNISVCV